MPEETLTEYILELDGLSISAINQKTLNHYRRIAQRIDRILYKNKKTIQSINNTELRRVINDAKFLVNPLSIPTTSQSV